MRGHPHLSIIAIRLRSVAVEEALDEPPAEIKLLLEKLEQQEMGGTVRDDAKSSLPAASIPRADGPTEDAGRDLVSGSPPAPPRRDPATR
jgi:hypothetical protein